MKPKKDSTKKGWMVMPSRTMAEWVGAYVTAALALEFYRRHGRSPTAIDLGSCKVKGLDISVDMV